MNSYYFKTKDLLQLHYEYYPNPQAKQSLVFIGGLSQSSIAWHGYLPLLSPYYNIVLIDLIFQGKSEAAPNYRSFEAHADDVAQLLQHLQLSEICVVGISYGGAVIQRLLVEHNFILQKAIIMASFAYKTPFFDAIGYSWASALEAGGYTLMLDVMLPFVLGKSYFANPLIDIPTLKTLRKELHPSPERLQALMKATALSKDYLAPLAQVPTPTLVLVGEEDLLCTPAMNIAIAQVLPKGKCVILANKGHTLNLEAIPETAHLIQQFISWA